MRLDNQKSNTGITWEDVGNAVWNTITCIVDPIGSIVRALNPPAVQSTQKEIGRERIPFLIYLCYSIRKV